MCKSIYVFLHNDLLGGLLQKRFIEKASIDRSINNIHNSNNELFYRETTKNPPVIMIGHLTYLGWRSLILIFKKGIGRSFEQRIHSSSRHAALWSQQKPFKHESGLSVSQQKTFYHKNVYDQKINWSKFVIWMTIMRVKWPTMISKCAAHSHTRRWTMQTYFLAQNHQTSSQQNENITFLFLWVMYGWMKVAKHHSTKTVVMMMSMVEAMAASYYSIMALFLEKLVGCCAYKFSHFDNNNITFILSWLLLFNIKWYCLWVASSYYHLDGNF